MCPVTQVSWQRHAFLPQCRFHQHQMTLFRFQMAKAFSPTSLQVTSPRSHWLKSREWIPDISKTAKFKPHPHKIRKQAIKEKTHPRAVVFFPPGLRLSQPLRAFTTFYRTRTLPIGHQFMAFRTRAIPIRNQLHIEPNWCNAHSAHNLKSMPSPPPCPDPRWRYAHMTHPP